MCNWFQNKSPTHTFAVDWDTWHGNWAAPCYFNGASPTGSARWGYCLQRHLACEGLYTWWRHQMETFCALLALCAGNSPVPGEFPAQRPVARSFDVFLDLGLNKRLSKQSWIWWFEAPSCPLWRHCNETAGNALVHTQHCGCWCPGPKASGHQNLQCCLNMHCIGANSYRNTTCIV